MLKQRAAFAAGTHKISLGSRMRPLATMDNFIACRKFKHLMCRVSRGYELGLPQNSNSAV